MKLKIAFAVAGILASLDVAAAQEGWPKSRQLW